MRKAPSPTLLVIIVLLAIVLPSSAASVSIQTSPSIAAANSDPGSWWNVNTPVTMTLTSGGSVTWGSAPPNVFTIVGFDPLQDPPGMYPWGGNLAGQSLPTGTYSYTPTSTGYLWIYMIGDNGLCQQQVGSLGVIKIVSSGAPEHYPPAVSFTGNPTTGTAPLAVQFTDSSTGSPASWSWNFGDSGTSTAQNPSHTYSAAGTYTVSLEATNVVGSGRLNRTDYITVSSPVPVASFTGTPTTGTAPLAVQFTDLSTGSPTSWSWNFGDSGTSTVQNPLHTYTSAGNYTVSLTAANTHGSNATVRNGYVTVTGSTVNYYVFADGVALYHNLDSNPDLAGADTTAQYFYNQMTAGQDRCHEYNGTTYCWNERSNPLNDNTGSKYWNTNELADTSGANSAEFAFHVGHGWEDGIVFGTFNSNKNVTRSEMRFSRAKWIAFDSCKMLNQSRQYDWESVFDGAHIIMGFHSDGIPKTSQGPQFVARMRGGTYEGTSYLLSPILSAWRDTMKDTIANSSYTGAYIYADPSGDDYLPGFGDFKEPTENNGHYTLHWENFSCITGG